LAKDVRELEMLTEENPELYNQSKAIERLWNSTTSIAEEVDDVKFQEILDRVNACKRRENKRTKCIYEIL
jgi:hypothetical protein